MNRRGHRTQFAGNPSTRFGYWHARLRPYVPRMRDTTDRSTTVRRGNASSTDTATHIRDATSTLKTLQPCQHRICALHPRPKKLSHVASRIRHQVAEGPRTIGKRSLRCSSKAQTEVLRPTQNGLGTLPTVSGPSLAGRQGDHPCEQDHPVRPASPTLGSVCCVSPPNRAFASVRLGLNTDHGKKSGNRETLN